MLFRRSQDALRFDLRFRHGHYRHLRLDHLWRNGNRSGKNLPSKKTNSNFQTTKLFLEYGPDDGNPATDPEPEWILSVTGQWRLLDPDKPGNYWPMVTERLKYCMYAIAPLTVAFAIAMLTDGTASSKEFRSPNKGRKKFG